MNNAIKRNLRVLRSIIIRENNELYGIKLETLHISDGFSFSLARYRKVGRVRRLKLTKGVIFLDYERNEELLITSI